ncbi:MAG: hypothetical protein E7496_08060 [Ruminococcus sp.]|nr:hypothetical protein [Ruminococcus sp.]
MTDLEKAIAFAKENDYDSAEYEGIWKEYHVYFPSFAVECFTGPPLRILEKDGKFRMSTPEEAFDILHDLHPSTEKERFEIKLLERFMKKLMKHRLL